MPTYLTKITTPKSVTRDIHRTHKILTTAVCPPNITTPGRVATRLLHRVERGGREILAQSATPLDPTRLEGGCVIAGTKLLDPLLDHLDNGTVVRYKITANPVHAPNRVRRPITDPDRILAWWHRTADRIGLVLDSTALLDTAKTSGMRRDQRVVVQTATMEGVATIRDVDTVRDAIVLGVGHARAYGCGLLSVVPLE
ncbi:type I-E CRISPR-associated protein Cas6/Cse3/CasE [Saccharomonospora viridis]|jgi:CRISPR system Cascade subunit CasE|uniref:CRISPR-associated protein, Cse3 family n=1 Tax=Saccharomonospora viridis (strain ATCC 15386 / DSM 43017 / JCM 3036 / CCUG 5913 / NBRC 12207 / NCIMB 9602 / P101) TaxID=471857 RepID=C7MQD7_SACVD|nr:type I-E CRISPR-associated protein Cas6/Cse3/CasE [Saccharomonospora viridis]ACU96436.1 CRISPR-associated protein, Cse3 family [Saccharomonospora viridis DSM 43017]